MLPQEILGVLRRILRHTEKHTELHEKRLIIIIIISIEEVGHGWPLLIKTTEVITTIDLGYWHYCKVLDPSLNLDLKTGAPLSKRLLRYEKSISVTSAILISKVQPCPTSSASLLAELLEHWKPSPLARAYTIGLLSMPIPYWAIVLVCMHKSTHACTTHARIADWSCDTTHY